MAMRTTTVHVNGGPRFISELGEPELSGPALPPGDRRVGISFSALAFAASEHLRSQDRPEGTDGDWSQPSADRVVHYSHLGSGRYRFQVRAVTSAAVVGDTPAACGVRDPAARVAAVVVPISARPRCGPADRRLRRTSTGSRGCSTSSAYACGLPPICTTTSAAACRASPSRARWRAARRRRWATSRHGGSTEIAESARGLVDALGDVVWSVDPAPRRSGERVSTPSRVRRRCPRRQLACAGRTRRPPISRSSGSIRKRGGHLFLLLKEGVTNVARHASARKRLARDQAGWAVSSGPSCVTMGAGFDTSAVDARIGSARHTQHAGASRAARRAGSPSSRRLGPAPRSSVRMPILGIAGSAWVMLLSKRLR